MESIVCNGIGKIYGKKQVLKEYQSHIGERKDLWTDRKKWCRKDDIVIHYVRTESGIRRNCDMEW